MIERKGRLAVQSKEVRPELIVQMVRLAMHGPFAGTALACKGRLRVKSPGRNRGAAIHIALGVVALSRRVWIVVRWRRPMRLRLLKQLLLDRRHDGVLHGKPQADA